MPNHDEETKPETPAAAAKTSRRDLLGKLALGGAALAAGSALPAFGKLQQAPGDDFDYIVVGSGAGGGPVACNLAKAGYRVLLLEAGANAPSRAYDLPVLHPFSTEE